MCQDISWKIPIVLNAVVWQFKDMDLILRDGIWMKEIVASNADTVFLLLDPSRKKQKDGSNLWNNYQIIWPNNTILLFQVETSKFHPCSLC